MDAQAISSRLTKQISKIEKPSNFLLLRFFNEVQDPTGQKIVIDVEKRTTKLAPFVSPCVEGVPIASAGFSTTAIDPTYIRLKDAPSLCSTGKRRFGEQPDTPDDPTTRLNKQTASVLMQHEDAIQARLVWMAAKALVDASYLVYSDHHPKYQVNFNRSANNTITLANPWKTGGTLNATATPLDDIESLGKAIFLSCRNKMTDLIMRSETWNTLSKHQDFVEVYKKFKGIDEAAIPEMTPKSYETVTFKGRLGEFNIWIYDDYYSENNTLNYYIPVGTILGVSAPAFQGFVAYGEIQNDKAVDAGRSLASRYVDYFYDDNVGKKFVQTEAAPLVVPGDPDATGLLIAYV